MYKTASRRKGLRHKAAIILLAVSMLVPIIPLKPVSAAEPGAGQPLSVFREDFSTGSAGRWTTYGSGDAGNRGVWSVNTAGQYTVSGSPGTKAIAEGTSFKDIIYEADLQVSGYNADSTGLLFRVSNVSGNAADGYNGYYASLGVDKRLRLGRVTGNGDVWKELASQPVALTSTRIKVIAEGNHIRIYTGSSSTPVIDYTDNDGNEITTAGAVGLRTWWGTSVIDNIEVREYSAAAAAEPVFSTGSGVYSRTQMIALTNNDPQALIRYTLDGSEPVASSPVYTAPIRISTSTVIKAYTEKPGAMASGVVRAQYIIASADGGFSDDFGSGNDDNWTTYPGQPIGEPAVWSVTQDVYEYSVSNPRGTKAVTDAVYSGFILETDLNPLNTPNDSGVIFRVSDPGAGADTMNGYYAGIAARGVLIVGKMSAGSGQGSWTSLQKAAAEVYPSAPNRLKVIALGSHYDIYLNDRFVTAFTDSDHTAGTVGLRAWNDNGKAVYDNFSVQGLSPAAEILQAAAPVFTPASASFSGSQEISLSSATSGAEIYYTLDGSVPTAASTLYTGPFTVRETVTVQALAVRADMDDSQVQSAVYTRLSDRFTEDFADPAAPRWRTYQGIWNANDGAYHVNKGAGFKSVAEGTDFANFTYEADVTLKDGVSADNAGVIFRVANPSNGADNLKGYYAGLGANSRVTLGRMNNNWKELVSVSYPVEQNRVYRLKVVALGANIDIYIDGNHVISAVDRTYTSGSIGVRSHWINAAYDNISVTDEGAVTPPVYDWSWVQGAVFVPTNAVNQLQQWDQYDHEINDRELSYAHLYGINLVRVFVHNLLWEDDSAKLLNNLEDFLQLADKYDIKVELVFFDDCWDDNPVMGPQLPPRYGAHNSRWVEGPGDAVKADYAGNKQKLKEYVQGIVSAYKEDPRIAFWNIYNEPSNGESGLMDQVTKQIMNDARIWIKETGSTLPVTSTGAQFSGEPTSDFITWHPYEADYPAPYGYVPEVLADEVMNRSTQTVPGVVENFGKKGIGFVMWEFGIGRDNTRFPWGSDTNPLTSEPAMPFHGIAYPDGHPWDVADLKALTGERFDTLPLWNVKYFSDEGFKNLAKSSVAPRIDFDLGNEKGTGSPDASAGIGEDHFSIRWNGTILPETSGEYSFYADSDNIAKVWVGNELVVDKTSAVSEEQSGIITLTAGVKYPVRVDYAHSTGDASLHVKWSGPQLAKTVLLPVYSGIAVEQVELDTDAFTLAAGESRQLAATVMPDNASGAQLSWSSSRTGVAYVDSSGNVRALNKGTAVITVSAGGSAVTDSAEVTVTSGQTFTNPVVPVSGSAGSADPSVVFKDGYYYYVKSENDVALTVAKTKRLQDIGTAPRVTVYSPPSGQPYSKELWAPELQFLNGKWYIYFAADDGNNNNHRMYVLESKTADAQGEYTFKGKISDPSDKWAIDGTALQKQDGSLYFIWSGWEGDSNVKQDLYIAPMSNPWTISGPRVRLSTPDQAWERNGGSPYINEGPEVLQREGKIYIVYSASGSWSDDYCLGMLTNTDGDVLNPASWTKNGPVFSKSPSAYGPGHQSFTTSPDGTEDWIVYHADLRSGGSWGNRSVRAQPFTWKADGTPDFGTPAAYGAALQQPAGTPEIARYSYEAEHAELGGTVRVNAAADASGGSVAGHIDTEGSDYVRFHVNVEEAGEYSLIVMAANGTSGSVTAQQTVTVNDAPVQMIEYRNFGWGRYNPSSLSVTLNAGDNTITLSKKTNFAELDRIILELLEPEAPTAPVESISLDQPAMTIAAGKTGKLTVSVKPLAGTDKAVTAVSDQPEIASVVRSGYDAATGSTVLTITGLKPGTATVRVTSASNGQIFAESRITVRGLPEEPVLEGYLVDNFDGPVLGEGWSIFQESAGNWSLTEKPGRLSIHTTATDVYQDNNSQNNVFLRTPETKDFEIVAKVSAPIAKNHQQAGIFVWQDADNFVKLAHVWDNGKAIETAYEKDRVYRKPGNPAAHPGSDSVILKIKKLGNVYTTYFWDGYEWIQAANPVTVNLSAVKIGLYANNIVATNDRIYADFDYFAVREITGGVDIDRKEVLLEVGESAQLTNTGASGSEIRWSSSNPEIAAVSASGLVQAKLPGRAVVTAASLLGDFSSRAVVTVRNPLTPPKLLYSEDFAEDNAADWVTYGGDWTVAEGEYTVNSGAGFKSVYSGRSFTDYIYEADVRLKSVGEAGLIFRASALGTGADNYEGYYLGISAASKSAVLGKTVNGQWTELASRKLNIQADVPVHLKVMVNHNQLQVFIDENPLSLKGFPKFDLTDASHPATGWIGLRTWNGQAAFDNVKVTSIGPDDLPAGATYSNSVMPGIADPYVLFHEGTYYLYGTHTADWPTMSNGIKVYTSQDLVHWTGHEGWALHKDNSWGDNRFWAPEVIEKDGVFYMYYAVEEHLAVAVSDSPLGPFVQKVEQPIHAGTKEIDAHIFTDDDGKQYMYFVRFNNGNEIWVAELNEDMASIKEDTLKFVMRATQSWELSQKAPAASINEGPFVIKHKGLYYLTYSGNHFESPDYGVGYATSESPTGPWTKYEYNPIMKSNVVVPGAGHHSLIYSPDGSELFMVYHAHNASGVTEPRKLAIDRVQFVPQASGIDAMEVWGPTVTPQLMPAAKGSDPGTDPGTGPGTNPGTNPGMNPNPAAGSSAAAGNSNLSVITEQEGKAKVSLAAGQTTARVALTAVADKLLEISLGQISVTITPEVFAAWTGNTGAIVEVQLLPAGEDSNGAVADGVLIRRIQAYEVQIAVTVNGKKTVVEQGAGKITLTLGYDPAAVDAALLGIYILNDKTGEWEYAGGVPDSAAHSLKLELLRPGAYALLEYSRSYDDVAAGHWVHRALTVLSARHVIYGDGAGRFNPQAHTTRAEFAAMLARSLGLDSGEGKLPFSDVGQEAWYSGAVSAAYSAGIIQGTSAGTFSPDANITREQMAVMLVRAYEYAAGSAITAEADELAAYADGGSVAAWARAEVNKAIAAGLMKGTGAQFGGGAQTLRAETVQAVFNLLEAGDR